jgi:predicted ATP-grasp superfamily ATP-dependent carboligase
MSDRPRVLITNAEERSMLAACRSLQRGGYDVTAASCTSFAPAQWSRSCARRLRIVDARDDADRFVEQLGEELARRPYATLIAGSDSSLLAISRKRERLQELTELGLPPQDVVERSLQRESLAVAAAQVGLIPAVSIRCNNLEEALTASRRLGFPVVLKSPEAPNPSNDVVPSVPKGRTVASENDLAQAVSAFQGELLVQRWVRGDLISIGGVLADERLLGVAVSRYQRMWPPDSGSVAFGETITPPPGLEDSVQRLLTAIGWEGIFELELIQSAPDEFVPIDLNPRPYGSMALASAAGAPLTTIWCDWLLDRNPSSPTQALAGYRYRWEDADLRHFAWQLRRGNYRAAAATALPHRRVTHAHFQLADPLPLIMRGLYLGKRASEGVVSS